MVHAWPQVRSGEAAYPLLAASASAPSLLTPGQSIQSRHLQVHTHAFVTTSVYGTRAGQYGREMGNFGFGFGAVFAHPYPTSCP